MKTVDWFSKITFPVVLSLVSTIEVTAAAFPLSRTSINLSHDERVLEASLTTDRLTAVDGSVVYTYLASFTKCPLVGIGPLIAMYCSP